MSGDSDDAGKPKRAKSGYADRPYDVGKGKPPVEHRFRPGNSGGGRPRGSRNQSDFQKLMREKIVVGEDRLGRPIRKSWSEVIDRQLLKKAAQGDLAAIRILKDFDLRRAQLERAYGARIGVIEMVNPYRCASPLEFDRFISLYGLRHRYAVVPPKVEGWDELVKSLGDLPARMLATLPPAMQNDPQVRQEVGRLALAGFASSALDTLSADGDHPFFLPQLNMILFAGQPNPDTLYRFTAITPGGAYRLRGKRGSIRLFSVGEQPGKSAKNGVESPSPIRAYHDFNALKVDAEGRFDVILSPARPAGYKGDWWQLQPDTDRLLLRMVSSDWRGEQQPTISIERIDAPANRPRPSAAEMEEKLRRLPVRASYSASMFVDKVEKLRNEGYVNRFKVFDVSGMGGLAGQFYYEGPYDLGDDEALIVEAKAPKSCQYRSIMITNGTYDTTDWYKTTAALTTDRPRWTAMASCASSCRAAILAFPIGWIRRAIAAG